MYCSRRGREVPRPTDTCSRCGRCNWEQRPDGKKAGSIPLVVILLVIAGILLAAALFFMR